MKYVHSKGIIHQDLKPGNIFIMKQGDAVIGDFGISRHEREEVTPEAGTARYSAPELFLDNGVITPKADVFSFGSILFEILTGNPVFPVLQPPLEIINAVRTGQMKGIPGNCGAFMQDLIPRCWSTKPEDRPSFGTILQDVEGAGYDIVPGACKKKVEAYVLGVQDWEWGHKA
jgi:serine/threonine protein kinase